MRRSLQFFLAAGLLAVSTIYVLPWLAQTNQTWAPPYKISRGNGRRAWKHGDVVPGQYIVHYHAPSDASLFARSHDDVVGALQSRGVQASVARRFDNPDFHAAIVHIPRHQDDASHAHHIRALPHVQDVEPVRIVSADAFRPIAPPDSDGSLSGDSDDAETLFNVSIPLMMPTLETRNDAYTTDTYKVLSARDIHTMTSVHEWHEKGKKGGDVVVVAMVNGVSLEENSRLGSSIDDSSKIKFGVDYVGDRVGDTTVPSVHFNDIQGTCNNKLGTAIARTIVDADGVAPGAGLGVYRVFDCQGDTSTAILMTALADAASLQAGVVVTYLDMAIHNSPVLAQQIASMQQTTVIAGASKALTVGGMFTSTNANQGVTGLVSVTSAETDVVVGRSKVAAWLASALIGTHAPPTSLNLVLTKFQKLNPNKRQNWYHVLQFPPDVTTDVLCDASRDVPLFPELHPNHILLLADADCLHTDATMARLHGMGIRRVLLETQSIDPPDRYAGDTHNLDVVPFRAYALEYQLAKLKEQTDATSIKIDLRVGGAVPQPFQRKNSSWRIARSSARGPSIVNNILSPTLAGPGQFVYWAADEGHDELDGNMIAAAYVAGSVAVMLSGKGNGVHRDQVVGRLINFAIVLRDPQGQGPLSVAEQGAGLLNLRHFHTKSPSAVDADAPRLYGTSFVNFGDRASQARTGYPGLSMQICHRIQPNSVTGFGFQVDVVPAATLYALDDVGFRAKPETVRASPSVKGSLVGSYNPNKFLLRVEGCTPFSLALDYTDVELDDKRIPVFSGYIRVSHKSDPALAFQTPYLGIASDLTLIDPIFSHSLLAYNGKGEVLGDLSAASVDEGAPADDGQANVVLDSGETFRLPTGAQRDEESLWRQSPHLALSFRYPPVLLHIGIVDAANRDVTTLYKTMLPDIRYVETHEFRWDGLVSDQNMLAPPGTYKFVVSAQKGASSSEAYQIVYSHSFQIDY